MEQSIAHVDVCKKVEPVGVTRVISAHRLSVMRRVSMAMLLSNPCYAPFDGDATVGWSVRFIIPPCGRRTEDCQGFIYGPAG